MSIRFTDWVIEEQEHNAMTDDEKAQIRKDLDEQKKAFELLRAVRELEAWAMGGFNRGWHLDCGPRGYFASCTEGAEFEYQSETASSSIDCIIALAAKVRVK